MYYIPTRLSSYLVDQTRCQDRQAAAVLDLARGAEEALGDLERARVEPAGHRAAAALAAYVVGSSQSRERVEEDDDVLAELHAPLAPLDDELGQVDVLVDGVVVGRSVNRAGHVALHVGDFLGALVDE